MSRRLFDARAIVANVLLIGRDAIDPRGAAYLFVQNGLSLCGPSVNRSYNTPIYNDAISLRC